MAATEGAQQGGRIRTWLHITENALGRVRGFLDCAGIQVPQGPFDLHTPSLVGRKLVVVVREEERDEWDERERQYVKRKRSNVAAFEPLAGASQQAAAQQPASAPAAQPVGASGGYDDIPF